MEPQAVETRTRYMLPAGVEPDDVLRSLLDRFPVDVARVATQTRRYYDTFDWDLFEDALALCRVGETTALWSLDHRPVGERTPFPVGRPFVADWPDSRLKTRLADLVSVRALLERATVHARHVEISARTNPPRPVANLTFENAAAHEPGLVIPCAAQVEVEAYPGADDLRSWFGALCGEPGETDGPLASLFAAHERMAYSSKLAFDLDPQMPCVEAARTIVAFLLAVVQRNVHGVLHDVDTEFLHDLRVAVRRARTLMGQLPGVFPKRTARRLRQDLGALGDLTNRLRDLDVLALQREDYLAALPAVARPDVEQTFRRLQTERGAAHHRLIAAWQARRCETVLERWHAVATGRTDAGPRGGRSLRKFVRGRVRKQCRRLVDPQQGRVLDAGDVRQVHRLRIEGKKLRYLFECFASVLPPDRTAESIRRLKVLQDALGDLHDLDVHQRMLGAFVPSGTSRNDAAAGGRRGRPDVTDRALRRMFEERRKRLRADARATYAEFIDEAAVWTSDASSTG